MSADMEVSSKF